MSVIEYGTQEDMDDDFEYLMEREQDKARLRERIEQLKHDIECAEEEVSVLNDDLCDAEDELRELEEVKNMDDWVTHELVTKRTGLKYSKLRGMIDREVLTRGVHFIVVERKRLFNIRAIQEWLNVLALEQRAQASKSDSSTKVRHTRSTPTKHQARQTSRMRLGIS